MRSSSQSPGPIARRPVAPFARLIATALIVIGAISMPSTPVAEPATKVYLNGKPAPVYFNDGDSFRVLGGEHIGTRARLAGFNTLETFGPVHQWGDWHAKELYTLSKAATLNAARGVWSCKSDFDTDTYGRTLWYCRDLAIDQIRRGLAHALSINFDPADPDFMAAQRQAMENKRGIWAHGTPAYVITSLHSVSEGRNPAYNRLVSTRDGHSAKWAHNDNYTECQNVCREERDVPDETIDALAKELLQDENLASLGMDKLSQAIGDFARLGYYGGIEDQEAALKEKLESFERDGRFGEAKTVPGSCHIYVEFLRRYGVGQAECLK